MKKIFLLLLLMSALSTLSFSQNFISAYPVSEQKDFQVKNNTVHSAEHINQITPDWIYDTNAPLVSSLKSADINNDGMKEIIITTYDSTGNPENGGMIYVLDNKGTNVPGWPKRIEGAPISATVSIGDINNDGYKEIVVGSWNQLFVLDYQGNTLPGFPMNYGTYVSASLFDLDNDGYLEIIYPSNDKNLYVLKYDGSFLAGWPNQLPEMPGSPAVADIDNDGEYEIICGTFQHLVGPDPFPFFAFKKDGTLVNGFPISLPGFIKSTPAIGDLDGDGSKEIVVVSYYFTDDDLLYVIDAHGNFKPGFPVIVNFARLSSPALGDLDGNGTLEILVGGMQNFGTYYKEALYGFYSNGEVIHNFPVLLNHPGPMVGNINSSPVICDIDGDTSNTEIVVKTVDYIFAIHGDTTTVSGFPYFINDELQSGTFTPSPLIDDMDNNGKVEYVFASITGKVHYFEMPHVYNKRFESWNSYKHDEFNTGTFLPSYYTGVSGDKSAASQFKLENNYPNPFNPSTIIKYSVQQTSKVTIKVFDMLGSEIETLVKEEKPVGTYELTWNAANHPSGVYFYQLRAGNFVETKKMILIK